MTVSIYSQDVNVRNIEFSTHKYGTELLVDAATIEAMPSFAKTVEPYTLSFYDITLITGGTGSFWLDDEEYSLKPNQVLFTTPGQVRRWYVDDLEGVCLFFPAEFLLSHFNDPLLLHRLRYFHSGGSPSELVLSPPQSLLLQQRLNVMRDEIESLQEDSDSLLRCIAHEIMIKLNRWYRECDQREGNIEQNPTVTRFRQSLEEHIYRYHNVCEYAALLSVTPGHLNVLCKKQMGRSASQLIFDRLYTEAKRRLAHSAVSVEILAELLGFSNTSYFCRAFKRYAGVTPLQYRKQVQHSA